MPNSLKCRLKKFVHKGLLSEKDLSRLYTDNDVIKEIEKIREEADRQGYYNKYDRKMIEQIIDNHIAELKGEAE